MQDAVKEKLVVQKQSDCWNCGHQKIGGDSFLGVCLARGKEIPSWVVDKGCSKFTTKYKKVIKVNQLSLL